MSVTTPALHASGYHALGIAHGSKALTEQPYKTNRESFCLTTDSPNFDIEKTVADFFAAAPAEREV